jgi:uncharacterized protein (TIGR02217 family)
MAETFIEVQFPTDISYGSKGGSGFNTSVFTTTAGFEQRNINWSKSRAEFDIGYGVRDFADMTNVVNFFMAMQGKAYSFRFKDWADFYLTNQQIAVGDGVTKVFQIIKTYTAGSSTYTRTINKPVAGTLQAILVNGSPVTSYTLDTTTGLITFSNAPVANAPIVVTYMEFDIPCRFDVDKLDVSQDYFNAEQWQGIKVIEVRLS